MSFLFYLLLSLFVLVCVIMMGLVLIQKGRGGGLAGAFGGAGGHTAFGSKTGDVLTWATSIIFGVFLLMAVGLNLMTDNNASPTPAPAAAPMPGPGSRRHRPATSAGPADRTIDPSAVHPRRPTRTVSAAALTSRPCRRSGAAPPIPRPSTRSCARRC